MSIYEKNVLEIEKLKKEAEYYAKQINLLPSGQLSTSKRGSNYAYYHTQNNKSIYISKNQSVLAEQLALKKYYQLRLNDTVSEIKAISQYLEHHPAESANSFLEQHEGYRALLKASPIYALFELNSQKPSGWSLLDDPIWTDRVSANPAAYKILLDHIIPNDNKLSWNYDGSCKAPYQELRTINTICGIKVRSKSEALIANTYFQTGILFVYEPLIRTGSRNISPDFFIFHPTTGIPIIHEHGGLLLDSANYEKYDETELQKSIRYTANFADKIQNYINNGWVPGINLIITSETLFHPFDSAILQSIIQNQILN